MPLNRSRKWQRATSPAVDTPQARGSRSQSSRGMRRRKHPHGHHVNSSCPAPECPGVPADTRYDDRLVTLRNTRTPEAPMARKLDDVIAALPASRRKRIEKRTQELATLKTCAWPSRKRRWSWLPNSVSVRTQFRCWKNAATCCSRRCGTMPKAWAARSNSLRGFRTGRQ